MQCIYKNYIWARCFSSAFTLSLYIDGVLDLQNTTIQPVNWVRLAGTVVYSDSSLLLQP